MANPSSMWFRRGKNVGEQDNLLTLFMYEGMGEVKKKKKMNRE